MASVLVPFLMSMILGRTIDLRTYEMGGDVFDNYQYDETQSNIFNTTYVVLQDNMLPYNLMSLPVDLALRIKSGILSSSSGHLGLDGLLRETAWKQSSVVVAVGTAVQTVQRSLKKDAKPLPNWTSRISGSQTHYANTIKYGGWLSILYRFRCDIPGDVEIVRETLTKALGVHGTLEPKTLSLWERALEDIDKNEEIRGKVNVYVHTYSTFPFEHNLTSPVGLLNAVNNIPELIGPVGKPMFMELLPLHSLDASYPVVTENHKLDRELEQIDEMYDDVKNTKNSINHWLAETDSMFSEEDETRVSDLVAHLSACLKLFHQVASEASVYKNMDQTLLNSAFKLYNRDLTHFASSYDRIFRRLKEDIDADCRDTFLHKIKGLLKVDDTERIQVGEVEGGLEECKTACLSVPQCRSIGYIDSMMILEKTKNTKPSIYKLILKRKICYVYFRSSSTANVVPPIGASKTGVYDRKCL